MPSTTNNMWSQREQRLALVSFVAFTSMIALFLLRDARSFVASRNDEIIGHVGASAGLTVAAAGALLALHRRRPTSLMVMAVGMAITITFELAQGLAPRRGMELGDVALGFAGVLLAAIAIDALFLGLDLLPALRVHVALAVAGSAVLLVMLVVDVRSQPITTAFPDGESCPLTALTGERQRIELGPDLYLGQGCLTTRNAGGFGLLGPTTATGLTTQSVLASSRLDDLVQAIVANERIVVRSEIVTDNFADTRRARVISLLRSVEHGDLMQLRTRGRRIEVLGPTIGEISRSFVYPSALEPDTRHTIELALTRTEMRVSLDGNLVALTVVDEEWLDALTRADDPQLHMYVGNSSFRTSAFLGVIEWVEVET